MTLFDFKTSFTVDCYYKLWCFICNIFVVSNWLRGLNISHFSKIFVKYYHVNKSAIEVFRGKLRR